MIRKKKDSGTKREGRSREVKKERKRKKVTNAKRNKQI
jgi:hypothetical protein